MPASRPDISSEPDIPEIPDITVVVMAYDEAQTLPGVVEDLRDVLGNMDLSYEILIVDDGSSDGTGAVADEMAGRASDDPAGQTSDEMAGKAPDESSGKASRVSAIHHEENLGLGGVYRTGFSAARGRYLTFFPADGQFPATIIEQFVPLMESHDLVMGYLPERPSTLTARALSWIERLLYRVMFGSFPQFQGIFMIRRALLDELNLCSSGRGWGIVMELVLKTTRGDYRTVSVPTEIRPRTTGRSKVRNLRTILANFRQLLTIRRYL
jgi:glycosyltransferase involved in cell wall biosynthesis